MKATIAVLQKARQYYCDGMGMKGVSQSLMDERVAEIDEALAALTTRSSEEEIALKVGLFLDTQTSLSRKSVLYFQVEKLLREFVRFSGMSTKPTPLSKDHEALYRHLLDGGKAFFQDRHGTLGLLHPPQRGFVGNDPKNDPYSSFGGVWCWGGDKEKESFLSECQRLDLQWAAYSKPSITPDAK